jgi:hypothetical protein
MDDPVALGGCQTFEILWLCDYRLPVTDYVLAQSVEDAMGGGQCDTWELHNRRTRIVDKRALARASIFLRKPSDFRSTEDRIPNPHLVWALTSTSITTGLITELIKVSHGLFVVCSPSYSPILESPNVCYPPEPLCIMSATNVRVVQGFWCISVTNR